MRPRCGRAAAAIRARDDLEEMPVRILEVDPATIVPGVDLAALLTGGIGPVRQPVLANALEDLVELDLAHEECIVLRGDFAVRAAIVLDIHVVQRGVTDSHHREWAEHRRRRQAEYGRQEIRGGVSVAGCADSMVQAYRHDRAPFWREGLQLFSVGESRKRCAIKGRTARDPADLLPVAVSRSDHPTSCSRASFPGNSFGHAKTVAGRPALAVRCVSLER